MKIELHSLFTISLWKEEFNSVIFRGESLIIINREGKPKSIKFPFPLRDLVNFRTNADIQTMEQKCPHQFATTSPKTSLLHVTSSSKLPKA